MHNLFTIQANALGMQYILFTKDEVENKNIKNGLRFFKKIDKQWAKYEEKVFIVIDGYDDDANKSPKISLSNPFKKKKTIGEIMKQQEY